MLSTLVTLLVVLLVVAVIFAIIREIAPDAFASRWLRAAFLCILLLGLLSWILGGAMLPHWR